MKTYEFKKGIRAIGHDDQDYFVIQEEPWKRKRLLVQRLDGSIIFSFFSKTFSLGQVETWRMEKGCHIKTDDSNPYNFHAENNKIFLLDNKKRHRMPTEFDLCGSSYYHCDCLGRYIAFGRNYNLDYPFYCAIRLTLGIHIESLLHNTSGKSLLIYDKINGKILNLELAHETKSIFIARDAQTLAVAGDREVTIIDLDSF